MCPGSDRANYKYVQLITGFGSRLIHISYANSLVIHGELEESLRYYRQALTINPRHASAYSNMGVAFLRLQRYEDAIFCFKRALSLDRTLSTARRNLCEVFADVLNDHQAAGLCWLELAALEPVALIEAVSAFRNAHNYELMINAYEAALNSSLIEESQKILLRAIVNKT